MHELLRLAGPCPSEVIACTMTSLRLRKAATEVVVADGHSGAASGERRVLEEEDPRLLPVLLREERGETHVDDEAVGR